MFNWMIKTYEKFSAAHVYWFGFTLNGFLYVISLTFAELVKMCKLDVASQSRGGHKKIRIRPTIETLKELEKRAKKLGTADMIKDGRNRGDQFEKIIVETYTGKTWHKDSTPFNIAGDMELNGEQIQIKFNGAELTNEKFLKRLEGIA